MTSIEEILMDVHKQIGAQGALLQSISRDVRETKAEAKNTNGRVSKLEMREEARDEKVLELAGAFLQLQTDIKKPTAESWFKLDWQKMILFFGSLATILALAIERLWR